MLKYKKLLKLGFAKPIGKKLRSKELVRTQSFYGQSNLNLQKLKAHYHNLTTGYLVRSYRKFMRKKVSHIQDRLVSQLETRLDSVVFRSGLVRSHGAAAQMVSHGHVYVNGTRVNVRSFIVKQGSIIKVSKVLPKTLKDESFKPPRYLSVDALNGLIVLEGIPNLEDVIFQTSIDLDKVVSALKR